MKSNMETKDKTARTNFSLSIKSQMIRLLGPHFSHWLSSTFGSKALDEVDLVYDYFKSAGHVGSRLLVDVGAHFGSSLGKFAADGWTVHAFEPDDKNRRILLVRHGHRKNIKLSINAASDVSGEEVSFYASEVSSGISGLSAFDSSHYEAQRVTTIRLDEYCRSSGISKIDFLKIDTEGHDLKVLKGLDFSAIRPQVIICEFEDRKTLPHGYDRFDMEAFLNGLGYETLTSEWHPIEEYGGQHKWKAFQQEMKHTANNSWGNIIAFDGPIPEALLKNYSSRFSSES